MHLPVTLEARYGLQVPADDTEVHRGPAAGWGPDLNPHLTQSGGKEEGF